MPRWLRGWICTLKALLALQPWTSNQMLSTDHLLTNDVIYIHICYLLTHICYLLMIYWHICFIYIYVNFRAHSCLQTKCNLLKTDIMFWWSVDNWCYLMTSSLKPFHTAMQWNYPQISNLLSTDLHHYCKELLLISTTLGPELT